MMKKGPVHPKCDVHSELKWDSITPNSPCDGAFAAAEGAELTRDRDEAILNKE
jgi:hypothetical protein